MDPLELMVDIKTHGTKSSNDVATCQSLMSTLLSTNTPLKWLQCEVKCHTCQTSRSTWLAASDSAPLSQLLGLMADVPLNSTNGLIRWTGFFMFFIPKDT